MTIDYRAEARAIVGNSRLGTADYDNTIAALKRAYEAGRKAERERCAKVIDEHFIGTDTSNQYKYCCDMSAVIRGAFPYPPLDDPRGGNERSGT